MNDIRDLYQQMIVNHSKNPRNKRTMGNADCRAEGYNPLCGDKVTLYVKTDGNVIADLSFEGSGCAISTASVSILTESLKGKTRQEVEQIFDSFHSLVSGKEVSAQAKEKLGKLTIFSGVQEFPVRVKCATLAWHTLKAALADRHETVKTE